MPRAALPRSGDSGDTIIMLAAFGVSSLFVAVQIAFAIAFAPIMIGLYEQAGLELPSLLAFAQSLGPLGIIVVLGVLDAAVFGLWPWALASTGSGCCSCRRRSTWQRPSSCSSRF